jgi:tetratricopeptide (TPR) repeat protein
MRPEEFKRLSLAAFVVLILSPITGEAFAQIPDEFTNLKILPKEIGKRELVGVMREMARDLGVRCKHCHVGPDNLEGMDFATDERSPKRTARVMMEMVRSINGQYLDGLKSDRPQVVEVKCVTCHHGLTVPRTIGDILAESFEREGIDATLSQYAELRKQYYGTAAYDFSPPPLNSLAERLSDDGKLDVALALLKLNVKYHPDDAGTRMMLGGVHQARGEKNEAIASYEKALEIDPKNSWARRQIEALREDS